VKRSSKTGRDSNTSSDLPSRHGEFDLFEDLVDKAEFASSLFGFYVHIPFCARRCGYCDFATFEGLEGISDRYLRALRYEIDRFSSYCGETDIRLSAARSQHSFSSDASTLEGPTKAGTTLYIGGGTPTLIAPDCLGEAVAPLLDTRPLEVSVEANPDSLDRAKAKELAHWSVSRVSLGVQSFDPSVLRYLDRTHSTEAVYAAIDSLDAAGITNFNIDLIYGSPSETLSSWERTLEEAVRCGPKHISCYALSLERGTPLYRKVALGKAQPPDPDDQADKMQLAANFLEDAGYRRYEVSSWALPGFECFHNLIYWGFGRYKGFGSGAHSFDGTSRYWNPRHPVCYIQAVWEEALPAGKESLDDETLVMDRVFMGLRRSVGIDIPDSFVGGVRTQRLVASGLIAMERGRLRATHKGMALLNEVVVAVAQDLIEAG